MTLVVTGRNVGTGKVQAAPTGDKEQLVEKIHGYDLSKWDVEGTTFVSIMNVNIRSSSRGIAYPHNFPIGQEDPPTTFGGMFC